MMEEMKEDLEKVKQWRKIADSYQKN